MDYTLFIQTIRSRLTFEDLAGHRIAQPLQETRDLDEFIDSVAEKFFKVPGEERAALSQMFVEWEGLLYLGDYVRRARERIRDHKDQGVIRLALAAILLTGDREDPRDSLYALGHLFRAAQQIGLRDPMPIFREVAALSNHQEPHSCAALMGAFDKTAVCQELAAVPVADLPALVRKGDTIGLRSCLEAGDNPNAVGARMVTPLMLAARKGSQPMLKLLLSAGAEINAHDDRGWSALVYAAEQGQWSAVELLVASGARTDVKPEGIPLEVFVQDRAASRLTKRGRKILSAMISG